MTAVGKRVFLLAVATIPNAMLCMTTTAGMVQKAALGRSKRPPLAVKKTAACVIPTIWRLQIDNKVFFLYRRSRTFFTANGGLFVFAAFQPATRQARLGVAMNIRELALEIVHATHRRKGRSPEKPQVFLLLLVATYPENIETHETSNACRWIQISINSYAFFTFVIFLGLIIKQHILL